VRIKSGDRDSTDIYLKRIMKWFPDIGFLKYSIMEIDYATQIFNVIE
jgi:hypothetical protein